MGHPPPAILYSSSACHPGKAQNRLARREELRSSPVFSRVASSATHHSGPVPARNADPENQVR